MPVAITSCATATVIHAARFWRIARDLGRPVQPALSKLLGVPGSGFLAPVLDGLLRMFEAGFARRFEAGDPSDKDLTNDERVLLALLGRDETSAPIEHLRSDLAPTMHLALRSTRIMLRSVLGRSSNFGADAVAVAT